MNKKKLIKKPKKGWIVLIMLFCGLFANTMMGQKTISWSTAPSDNNWGTAGNWNYTAPAITFAATNVSGTDTITLTVANAEISAGDVVSGNGVPVGATITNIDGTQTIITISAVTTSAVTSVSFTFAIPKPGAVAQTTNKTDITVLTGDIIYNVESANTYYQRRIQNLGSSVADMTLFGTGTVVIDVDADQFYTFGGYAIIHQSTTGTKFTVDCQVKLNNTFGATATNRNNVLRCLGNASNILEFGSNSVLENTGFGPIVSYPQSGTVLMNGQIKPGVSNFTCGTGNTTFGPTSNNPLFTVAANTMNIAGGANVEVNTTAGNTFYKNTLGSLRFNNFAANISATVKLNNANVWNSPLFVNTLSIDRLTGANLIVNADQTTNVGTVTLSVATSVLNLTVANGVSVNFGNSAAATWTAGSVLNIYGFDSATSIKFGTSAAGLTATQLQQICIKDGVNAGKAVVLDATGKLIVDTATNTWLGTNNVYSNIANWSLGALPTANSNVVIPDTAIDPIMGSNGSMYSLTVEAGATLTVNNNFILNVSGKIANSGTINVYSNANIIQRFTVPNTGSNFKIFRTSSTLNRLDFTLWSSPVSGTQTLAQFSPLTSSNRFYSYNPASDAYDAISSSIPFTTGTGYLIRMPNENPGELGTSSAYYTGTAAISYLGIFQGVANNGTYPLTGLTPDKFYAVGNPYPSAMNATTFLANNATGGTLYFWRKTNGATGSAYATRNSTGGTASGATAPNNNIPSAIILTGQGFIVKTGPSATSLTFSNGMRSNSVVTTNYFFKTKEETAATEPNRVWLNLTSAAGVFSQALIGYTNDATLGFDNGYDGEYINDSQIALTSNIDNKEYTIQARPAFDATDVVALNFKTNVAGDFNIALDHFDGVFTARQDVYLVDSKTGAETDLKTNSYNFKADVGIDNNRFSLKYQKTLKVDEAAFNENSVNVYKNNGALYVNSGAVAISNIKVFDIQGRVIAEQKNLKTTTAVFNNLKAGNQVLIFKITGEDNNVVTKKVVN